MGSSDGSFPDLRGEVIPFRSSFLSPSGIDVQQVTIVVNFSLPTDQKSEPDFETYLHRIGRTGRFGKKGVAFSMVESQNVALVQMIEEHFREYPRVSASPGGRFGTGDPSPAPFPSANGPRWVALLPGVQPARSRRQIQLSFQPPHPFRGLGVFF